MLLLLSSFMIGTLEIAAGCQLASCDLDQKVIDRLIPFDGYDLGPSETWQDCGKLCNQNDRCLSWSSITYYNVPDTPGICRFYAIGGITQADCSTIEGGYPTWHTAGNRKCPDTSTTPLTCSQQYINGYEINKMRTLFHNSDEPKNWQECSKYCAQDKVVKWYMLYELIEDHNLKTSEWWEFNDNTDSYRKYITTQDNWDVTTHFAPIVGSGKTMCSCYRYKVTEPYVKFVSAQLSKRYDVNPNIKSGPIGCPVEPICVVGEPLTDEYNYRGKDSNGNDWYQAEFLRSTKMTDGTNGGMVQLRYIRHHSKTGRIQIAWCMYDSGYLAECNQDLTLENIHKCTDWKLANFEGKEQLGNKLKMSIGKCAV